jgi:hypothetical protein
MALFACTVTVFAQAGANCGQTLDSPLRAKTTLTIESRPAGLKIVGTDSETLRVTCTTSDPDSSENVRIRFTGAAGNGKLTIAGGYLPHGNLQVRIEVPRKTSLRVDMPAGQVDIDEVIGDKDVDLYAGQITIASERPWNYRAVSASVDIGQVNAPVYGANKGGFFRSFTIRDVNGDYRLRAHVMTGQIDLLGNVERAAE